MLRDLGKHGPKYKDKDALQIDLSRRGRSRRHKAGAVRGILEGVRGVKYL